ncbi:PqiC family protein [Desulfogranum marinum]|uniref:PqiC family protein n=1 Tax=Desulfogranum marinum TaxID=453220 RepID=UPI0029C95202|nr:PqiC family protein [Desulfogranum marinum]
MITSAKYSLLFLLLLSVAVCGCSLKTPKAVYYTLNPIENISTQTMSSSPPSLAIGIGPVKFPSELDRPSIVTRTGQSRLVIDEFHRWGGSLEKNFLRVMADNLSRLLNTDQVMIRPWEHYFQPEIRIIIDIRQFDGRLDQYAVLETTWVIHREGEEKGTVVHRSSLREPVAVGGYDALVAAQSRLIGKLSEHIAKVIVEI